MRGETIVPHSNERLADFEVERPRLLRLGYRMLGSFSEAEDIVQEAWLRWTGTAESVDTPAANLTRIVTRLCLDQLKSARVRRETYVGAWLPEPLMGTTEADEAIADGSDPLGLDLLGGRVDHVSNRLGLCHEDCVTRLYIDGLRTDTCRHLSQHADLEGLVIGRDHRPARPGAPRGILKVGPERRHGNRHL